MILLGINHQICITYGNSLDEKGKQLLYWQPAKIEAKHLSVRKRLLRMYVLYS